MKHGLVCILAGAAAMVAAIAPSEAAPTRPPRTPEQIERLLETAPMVVHVKVDSVEANATVDPRLAWEVRGPVLEVLKGELLPGPISIHVESVVRAFDQPREALPRTEYVAALAPLGDPAERRFQLAGPHAFPADGTEARMLRGLVDRAEPVGTGGEGLRLVIQPEEKVFAPGGAKKLQLRLTNEGDASATYIQAPVAVRGEKLYLPGRGGLRIRDADGTLVPDRGNVLTGQAPPPPPTPALILPKASFVEVIDLDTYYELAPGRYTAVLILATPNGLGTIPSNGLSIQVGAVDLPPPVPLPPAIEAALLPADPEPPEVSITQVPPPASYRPGDASGGLAALLRPEQSTFELGMPVEVEFRLINVGPRTVKIDARLERTLTFHVTPVRGSPRPSPVRNVVTWPETTEIPAAHAYLREGDFWGRLLDLNILYGRELASLKGPSLTEVRSGKDLPYARYGPILYGFDEPGLYKIIATYDAGPIRPPEGGSPDPGWWTGDVRSNPILIQIVEAPAGVRR